MLRIDILQAGRKSLPAAGSAYSKSRENIGNLPKVKIDEIISSPPYAEETGYQAFEGEKGARTHDIHEPRNRVKRDYAVSRDPDNTGKLGFGAVGAIITSPPYGRSEAFQDPSFVAKAAKDEAPKYRAWEIKGYSGTR